MVACAKLKLFSSFLRSRHYPLVEEPGSRCDVLVCCADHLTQGPVHDWGLHVPGPKVVVGGDPPTDWRDAHRVNVPILPLQLEQYIQHVCSKSGALASTTARRFELTFVEDDPTIRAAVTAALEASGFHVRACSGFGDFNATIHHGRTDLILLDLNLPGFSGETLAGFIRGRGIPIALFSSVPANELEAARQRIGAVAAFSKSDALGSIAQWIRTYLERPA
jgi:CheY-like chemotaxis protein